MLNKYYEILGLSNDASVFEIKQAFRNRAKELHPDVNKNQNAHEQFILLLEAYEYLINQKKNTTKDKNFASSQRWQDNAAARAKHRAEYFSKINYKKFVNSDYFKTVTSLSTIFEHLGFFIGVGILIPVPVILIVLYGLSGVIISLFIMFITLPLIRQAIKSRSSINIEEFFRAVAFVTKTRDVSVLILSILNLFIVLKVGFQTLIPFTTLIWAFGLTMAFIFFFTRFELNKKARSSAVISFCYCPFILNLLLAINFLFSANPGWEIYSFTHQGNNAEGKLAYINLENNRYRDYSGIRIFADFNSMKDANKIAYKFEDGLLGFRVMKDYKFYKDSSIRP